MEKLYTTNEVAELTKMHHLSLLRLIGKKQYPRPKKKFGQAYVWTQAEVDKLKKFLAERDYHLTVSD